MPEEFMDDLAEVLWRHCTPDAFAVGLGAAERFDFSWGTFIAHRSAEGVVAAWRVPAGQETLDWEEILASISVEYEPEEGDYVIQDVREGYEVTPLGVTYHGDEWDVMMKAIERHMDEHKFWPDIWHLSDHGNFVKISRSGA